MPTISIVPHCYLIKTSMQKGLHGCTKRNQILPKIFGKIRIRTGNIENILIFY